MKILIVSDAWLPQVNGVVRTLLTTKNNLEGMGHEIHMITPDLFYTLPCPTYSEIRLAVNAFGKVGRLIEKFQPHSIHIATEGPLGIMARNYCVKYHYPFTTSFHTKFPEYIYARFGIPASWIYRLMRWFHSTAERVMVATASMRKELQKQGITNLAPWSRGVDVKLFRPQDKNYLDMPRPVSMYVGRVAIEKNVEAFLKLDIPGTKVIVGQGPQTAQLQQKYPTVRFVGTKQGEDLARHYAAADVFVFPSLTDTFGLVMLEALACGVPVAAYPVSGPVDIVTNSNIGCLDNDLQTAVECAMQLQNPSDDCRQHALQFSWEVCTQQFLDNLAVINADKMHSNKSS